MPLQSIYFAAIIQNGLVLELIEQQSYQLCINAVKQNGLALQFVKQQNEELCLLAVQQNE